MILPIALKYDKRGILEIVRCLYFDIIPKATFPDEIKSKMQAFTLEKFNQRPSFSHSVMYSHSERIFNANHNLKPSLKAYGYMLDTQDIQPDSQYAFLNYLSFASSYISNFKVIEYPAEDYIAKYGILIKTQNMAQVNADNKPIQDVIQVIVPKIALLTTSLPDNYNFYMRQEVLVINDKQVVTERQYQAYLSTYSLPELTFGVDCYYEPDMGIPCTAYAVDYNGKVFKTTLDKLYELDLHIGNITKRTSHRLNRRIYKEGYDYVQIERVSVADGTIDAGLGMQSTLLGLSMPLSEDYTPAIPGTAKAAIIPDGIEHINLRIPANYALEKLRCPDVITSAGMTISKPLDMLLLPKYARTLMLDLNSVGYLQLPIACYYKFHLECVECKNTDMYFITPQDKLNLKLHNAPNLKTLDLLVSDNYGLLVQRRHSITINNSPNFRLLTLRQVTTNISLSANLCLIISIDSENYVIDLQAELPRLTLVMEYHGYSQMLDKHTVTILLHHDMDILTVDMNKGDYNIINIKSATGNKYKVNRIVVDGSTVGFTSYDYPSDDKDDPAPEIHFDNIILGKKKR